MSEATWYCAKDGQRLGPFSFAQLRQMMMAGALGPADLVWQEGLTDWTAAGIVPGLFPAPPPLPSRADDQAPLSEPLAPNAHEPVPPSEPTTRCSKCGWQFGPDSGGNLPDISCPHCGAVSWGYVAGVTLGVAVAFALVLLVAVHSAYLWLRVVAAVGCLLMPYWILMTRWDLLKAARLRNPHQPSPGSGSPRHVQAWTAVAVVTFIGVTVVALAGYNASEAKKAAGPPTTPAKYAIKGEAFCTGDKLMVTTKTNLLNARFHLRGPDGITEVPMDSKRLRVEEWTLGQVADRQPTRMTAQLKNAELWERVIDGKSLEETVSSPLAGVLVTEFSRTLPGAAWTKKIAPETRLKLQQRDVNLLDAAEAEIAGSEAWHAKDELYPDEPIALGHEWVKSGTNLRSLLGMDVLAVEGEARFKVAEFMQFKGLTCAQIAVSINSKGTIWIPDVGKVEFTLVGSGTIVRSIRHGVDLLVSITGTTEHTGQITDRGVTSSWTLAGPISIEESTAVQRSPTSGRTDSPSNVQAADAELLAEILKKASEIELPSRKPPTATPPVKTPTPKGPSVVKLPPPLPGRGTKGGVLMKLLPRTP